LFTGHSLGGALATLAALDVKRQINPSNTVYFYTYGCPRVGN
jgi:predicted lipase